MVPCLIFEDDHLLVVNKPAGINTHAPGPFAGEGIYDWLRHREPRWSNLAIIHRLDKETSGVMVFGKTPLANRSLTDQFSRHTVRKRYRLLTDRPVKSREFTLTSVISRAGEKYLSRPLPARGDSATTHFRILEKQAGRALLEAEPVTGRTHQIRAQAAASGFPVLGDALYGGTPHKRVCLHSTELQLKHPETGAPMDFEAPSDFDADPRLALRQTLIDPDKTDIYRLIHGAADGWPGWFVERLGEYLLAESGRVLNPEQRKALDRLAELHHARGSYHSIATRKSRPATPRLLHGKAAPAEFPAKENGLRFELSFQEGHSFGLFPDQRDNRRRLLTKHVAAGFPLFTSESDTTEVLNVFAYTCGFSVCAAKAGARTTSLDLSKNYLEWGRRNFELNRLDPANHDFIYGDAFDWLGRLAKKGRLFDLILLDPPTFSRSKARVVFQAEKDFGRLTAAALPVLKPGGVLFISTNATKLSPENFLKDIENAIKIAHRKILQQHYAPQPPDYPIHREEPAHLKTVWLRVS